MRYYPAFICENGHLIESTLPSCAKSYCPECGARVITVCPNCQTAIKGNEYGTSGSYHTPNYCDSCGKPFPWISAAVEATTHLLHESDLDYNDQQKLIEVLPDVISETPKSRLAAFRFQKAITTAGAFVAEGLRQFVIDFGCELLKKLLGL